MALKFGKRDVNKMADVLDAEYETVEEAAQAALEAAMSIIEAKAKFTVVSQVSYTDNEWVKPSDPRAEKVALGWYSTEKQALDDALKMAYSTQTHEEHRSWVLPLHHGTPNDYYVARKKAKKAQEAGDTSYREKELQRRIKWIEEHPGEKLPEDWTVEVASEADTDECEVCKGMGRVPKAHLTRRADTVRYY